MAGAPRVQPFPVAGLLSVPALTLLGLPAIHNIAFQRGDILQWHLRPTGPGTDSSKACAAARCAPGGDAARGDAARGGAACGGAARGCVISGGAAHDDADLGGGAASDDEVRQVPASAAMPVVVAVDLAVGRRLRSAGKRQWSRDRSGRARGKRAVACTCVQLSRLQSTRRVGVLQGDPWRGARAQS